MSTPDLPTGSGALHERARELELLEQALIDAKADESRLVLIEGQAGIGKSRLLLEMRRMAEAAGFAVVSARGYEYQRDYGFGMLRQLIGNAQRETGEHAVSSNADEADALVVALGGDEQAATNAFAIFEGCYWATVRAAETTPILIAIDDLQWCDRPSLEYVAYLSRRIESLPIVIAATVRPAESSPGAAAVRELMSDPDRLSIAPKPLGAGAVAAMTSERLTHAEPDPAFVAELVEITGGNPLLVDELLKELAAEQIAPLADAVERLRELGPRAASRSVLLRLARLPEECSSVVRALAIFGEGVSNATIAEFLQCDEQSVATALAQAASSEIIRPEPPLGFVHPLVREAVYRDISTGEREHLHMRAARQLDAVGESAQRVAAQLLHVPPRADQWVFEKLQHAGHVALSKGALASAVSHLARALEEPPPRDQRATTLRDLALAESLVNPTAAGDRLLAAWELFDDPLQRGFITVQAMRVLNFAERNAEAVRLAERTLEQLSDEHRELRQRIENGLLSITLTTPQIRPFATMRELLDAPPGAVDTVESRMFSAAAAYGKMLRCDPVDECVALAAQALGDDLLFEYDNGGFPMLGAQITLAVADDPRVIEYADRSTEWAGRGANPAYAPAVARNVKGMALVLQGDLIGAFEMLELALADVELFDIRLGHSQVRALLATACVESGDLARAERELAESEAFLTEGLQRIAWLGAKLRLLVQQGRNDEALRVADQIEHAGYDGMIENPGWLPWRSLKAVAFDGLDRGAEALDCVDAELEAARRWGAPRPLGRALRIRGQIKRRAGIDDLEQSVDLLRGAPARLEYGWALAALGTALRHERKALAAREPLTEALQIAVRSGAAGLERHVRDELAASGAAPRASDFEGMDALTPSERRVAALAVDGLTNREIAQKLFVTPKTIEVHLSNVYKKLGVKSRRDLPAVFISD